MKKGTLLVVRKPYQGDTVIQNTLNYAIGSLFADEEDILTSHIDNEDDSDQIIEEYYRLQAPYNMTDHIIWYYAPMQITAHPTAGWNTLPIPLVQESGSAQSQIFRNGFAAVSNIKRCPSFDFLKSRITLPTLFSAKTAWSNSKYQTGPKTIPYWNTTIPVKKIQGFSFSRLPKFTN